MYQPTDCKTLENVEKQQIRLLLQGMFGSGKTYSALTASNPCVINFDNNLGAHSGRKDVINVPFYDDSFVKKYNDKGWRHLALVKWIQTEGKKLAKEQTLVIDGLTNLSNHYDRESPIPISTRTGKEDLQAWWGNKWEWNKGLFEDLKAIACDVIVCCHEQIERDSDGNPTTKNRPLISGSFKDEIGGHFTDIFRQLALSKPSDKDLEKIKFDDFGLKSIEELKIFMNTFTSSTIYLWQLKPDSIANCKTHLFNPPKFALANYSVFSRSDK